MFQLSRELEVFWHVQVWPWQQSGSRRSGHYPEYFYELCVGTLWCDPVHHGTCAEWLAMSHRFVNPCTDVQVRDQGQLQPVDLIRATHFFDATGVRAADLSDQRGHLDFTSGQAVGGRCRRMSKDRMRKYQHHDSKKSRIADGSHLVGV